MHAANALTLMPHSAVKHFCSIYDMAVVELGEPKIWAWEMLVYKNYESLRPLARALLRQTTEYAQEMLREDPVLNGGT